MTYHRDGGGAGAAHTDPAQKIRTATSQQDRGQDSAIRGAVEKVTGTEHRPIGRARLPRVEVLHDRCGHVHSHRRSEVEATSIVRAPACAPHTRYRVTITEVVPASATRPGGQIALDDAIPRQTRGAA